MSHDRLECTFNQHVYLQFDHQRIVRRKLVYNKFCLIFFLKKKNHFDLNMTIVYEFLKVRNKSNYSNEEPVAVLT